MKIEFIETPHDTIRVFVHFANENEKKSFIDGHTFCQIFDGVCFWGGWDKSEILMRSWEFHKSLREYFWYRFGENPDVTMNILPVN